MLTFGKVKSTPLVKRQPARLITLVVILRSSIHSFVGLPTSEWYMISLMRILPTKLAFGSRIYVQKPPVNALGGTPRSWIVLVEDQRTSTFPFAGGRKLKV